MSTSIGSSLDFVIRLEQFMPQIYCSLIVMDKFLRHGKSSAALPRKSLIFYSTFAFVNTEGMSTAMIFIFQSKMLMLRFSVRISEIRSFVLKEVASYWVLVLISFSTNSLNNITMLEPVFFW